VLATGCANDGSTINVNDPGFSVNSYTLSQVSRMAQFGGGLFCLFFFLFCCGF
jgi:hypothetical protein